MKGNNKDCAATRSMNSYLPGETETKDGEVISTDFYEIEDQLAEMSSYKCALDEPLILTENPPPGERLKAALEGLGIEDEAGGEGSYQASVALPLPAGTSRYVTLSLDVDRWERDQALASGLAAARNIMDVRQNGTAKVICLAADGIPCVIEVGVLVPEAGEASLCVGGRTQSEAMRALRHYLPGLANPKVPSE